MNDVCDVLIVGAGPAGSSLAIELCRRGWDVVLLDADCFPREKVCGEFLGPAAWPMFERLGMAERLQPLCAPIEGVRLILPHRPPIRADYSTAERHFAIRRYVLDRTLVDRAAHCGARVELAQRAREVIVHDGAAIGIVTSSVDRAHQGRRWTAPLIVAADGRNSIVVRQTGSIRRDRFRQIGFKSHVRLPAGDVSPRVLDMYLCEGGYVGLCHTQDDTWNVCGVLARSRLQASENAFVTALARAIRSNTALESRLAGTTIESWKTMADVRRQSAVPRVEGVVYLGDARRTIDPLTGQGMTMAMGSALSAADLLLEAGRPAWSGSQQECYEQACRQSYLSKLRSARWLGDLIRHPHWLETALPAAFCRSASASRVLGWLLERTDVRSELVRCVDGSRR